MTIKLFWFGLWTFRKLWKKHKIFYLWFS